MTEQPTEVQIIEELRNYALQEFKTVFPKNISKSLEEGTITYAIERLIDQNKITLDPSKNLIDQIEDLPFQELKFLYKQVFIKVLSNIKFNENKDFVCSKILEKEWNPKDVPRMHREILFPERWDSLYKDRTEHLSKKRKKGMHRCPRCKSWFTNHVEYQNKGADESCTVKCDCTDCNYTWVFS